MAFVKTHVARRRNARGGRTAGEHLVAALRCLYRRTAASWAAARGRRIVPGRNWIYGAGFSRGSVRPSCRR